MGETSGAFGSACPLCGLAASNTVVELGGFRVVRCRGCGLGRTQPLNRVEPPVSPYTVANRLTAYKSRFAELTQRYRRQLDEIRAAGAPPGGTLLDVGCSLGLFLSVARDQGYNVHGVEVAGETARYAQSRLGLDVFCGTLEAARYPDSSFDVVTFWDVVEHVRHPVGLLTEARRILKDGGLVAVQSPNMESRMARVSGPRWSWWTVPDHLYHFTPATMRSLLELCGFHVETLRTWEPPMDLLYDLLIATLPAPFVAPGLAGRVGRRLARCVASVGWRSVTPVQRVLWQRGEGGLVVAYASKRSGG